MFVIVGGVTRLIPSPSITLPFVSFGGSSRWPTARRIALLCRISDEGSPAPARPAAPPTPGGDGHPMNPADRRVAVVVLVGFMACASPCTGRYSAADRLASDSRNTRVLIKESTRSS